MKRLRALYGSTIGKKSIVAITGAIMLGFLIGHVSGNLKVFLPDPAPGVLHFEWYTPIDEDHHLYLIAHAAVCEGPEEEAAFRARCAHLHHHRAICSNSMDA